MPRLTLGIGFSISSEPYTLSLFVVKDPFVELFSVAYAHSNSSGTASLRNIGTQTPPATVVQNPCASFGKKHVSTNPQICWETQGLKPNASFTRSSKHFSHSPQPSLHGLVLRNLQPSPTFGTKSSHHTVRDKCE